MWSRTHYIVLVRLALLAAVCRLPQIAKCWVLLVGLFCTVCCCNDAPNEHGLVAGVTTGQDAWQHHAVVCVGSQAGGHLPVRGDDDTLKYMSAVTLHWVFMHSQWGLSVSECVARNPGVHPLSVLPPAAHTTCGRV